MGVEVLGYQVAANWTMIVLAEGGTGEVPRSPDIV